MLLTVGCYCGYRLVRYEKAQNERIADLQNQIDYLSSRTKYIGERVSDVEQAVSHEMNWGDGFNYLAIGNSITVHSTTDYWWGEWGMAASSMEKDYVHLIVSELEETYDNVNVIPYNYSVWETQSHDRDETWELIDFYLSDTIDLISIQLSENVNDMTTFSVDFQSLLNHVSEKCPNSRIVVIGDFWSIGKSEEKKAVCEELGIPFVDLSDIMGKQEYRAGLGNSAFGEDGIIHTIEHDGVAMHPGDKGMQEIAKRVLDLLN